MKKVNLSELLDFLLTLVLYGIGPVADGMLSKRDKATSIHYNTKYIPPVKHGNVKILEWVSKRERERWAGGRSENVNVLFCCITAIFLHYSKDMYNELVKNDIVKVPGGI